ncbi:hypothetical protein WJX72_010795 [[Myrmecia] bisecta]|uniref:Uncharacterized protein n=1 Tax=[Myrmecia] bisecta TaxID=41462 RepID=A0AAW1P920_9CHLO
MSRNLRSTASALAAIGFTVPSILCPWYTVCSSVGVASTGFNSSVCTSISIAQAASGFKARWLLVFLFPAVTAFAAALAKYSRRQHVGAVFSCLQAVISVVGITFLCVFGGRLAEHALPDGVAVYTHRLGWYMALASNIAALLVGAIGTSPPSPSQGCKREWPTAPSTPKVDNNITADLEQGVIGIPSEPSHVASPARRTPLMPRQAMLNRFNVHDNPMAFDSLMPMRLKMAAEPVADHEQEEIIPDIPEHEMSNEEYERSLRHRFANMHSQRGTDENRPADE